MIIFVTGHQRAGTHTYAEGLSKNLGLGYVEENFIHLDSWELLIKLIKDNVVIQCPFLAHKSLELAKMGTVYWCARNTRQTVISMANGSFDTLSWRAMRGFRNEFPNDPIWGNIKYDGKNDVYNRFIKYHQLLVETKEYFYDKYFSGKVERVELEKREDYKPLSSYASKMPLKPAEEAFLVG